MKRSFDTDEKGMTTKSDIMRINEGILEESFKEPEEKPRFPNF